jgi:DNA polymerase-3 subunit gamma/tau
MLLSVSARQRPRLKRIVDRWTIDTITLALQIFAECRARMRGSSHGRLLLDIALVRVARLENLTAIPTLVERLAALESGMPPARTPQLPTNTTNPSDSDAPPSPTESPRPKRERPVTPAFEGSTAPTAASNDAAPVSQYEPPPPDVSRSPSSGGDPTVSAVPEPQQVLQADSESRQLDPGSEPSPVFSRGESPPFDLLTARKVWPELFKKVGARLGLHLSQVEPIAVMEPEVLVIAAKPGYNSLADECGTVESLKKIEEALLRLTRRPVTVKYERAPEDETAPSSAPSTDAQRLAAWSSDPLLKKMVELFEAREHHIDFGDSGLNEPA